MTIKVIHLDSGDFLNLQYGGYGLEQLNEQLKGAIKVDVFQDSNHGTRFVAQWLDEPPFVPPAPFPPAYVHTFVHAHSNWVAVDSMGTVIEFVNEPEKTEPGNWRTDVLAEGVIVGNKRPDLIGLKQKRQR